MFDVLERRGGHQFKNHPLMIKQATILYRQRVNLPDNSAGHAAASLRRRCDVVSRASEAVSRRTVRSGGCPQRRLVRRGGGERPRVSSSWPLADFAAVAARRRASPMGATSHLTARRKVHQLRQCAQPSHTDGRRALHLVRRVWACGRRTRARSTAASTTARKPRASLVQSSLWRWAASRPLVVMRRELRRRRRGRLRPQHRRASQLLCAVVRRAAIEA